MSKTVAIGILHGREETFPAAVMQEINGRESSPGAESIVLGGLFPSAGPTYQVIVDRISHRVPFYRSFLRQQVGLGAWALPEAVALQSLDRLVVAQLAFDLDIPALPTVALPTKDHPLGVSGDDLMNLVYPLPWDAILERIGFPAVFRPLRLEGDSFVPVNSLRQLWDAYALTANRRVILQSAPPVEARLMVLVIGEQTLVLSYDNSFQGATPAPGRESTVIPLSDSGRYLLSTAPPQAFQEAAKTMTLALTQRCQLKMAGAEWAVIAGQLQLVDLHCCPNLDWWALGETHFAWAVAATADLAIELAHRKTSPSSPLAKTRASKKSTPESKQLLRQTGR